MLHVSICLLPYLLLIYSLVDGHWGCFQVFLITNKATVNIHVKIFKWRYIFLPFKQIPRGILSYMQKKRVYKHKMKVQRGKSYI